MNNVSFCKQTKIGDEMENDKPSKHKEDINKLKDAIKKLLNDGNQKQRPIHNDSNNLHLKINDVWNSQSFSTELTSAKQIKIINIVWCEIELLRSRYISFIVTFCCLFRYRFIAVTRNQSRWWIAHHFESSSSLILWSWPWMIILYIFRNQTEIVR